MQVLRRSYIPRSMRIMQPGNFHLSGTLIKYGSQVMKVILKHIQSNTSRMLVIRKPSIYMQVLLKSNISHLQVMRKLNCSKIVSWARLLDLDFLKSNKKVSNLFRPINKRKFLVQNFTTRWRLLCTQLIYHLEMNNFC